MADAIGNPTIIPTLQFHFASDKADPDYGLKICEWVSNFVSRGFNNYYDNRNRLFHSNRTWAEGRQDMAIFMDLMGVKGRKAFINIDFSPPAIMPKYVQQIMDLFMDIDETPKASAVDTRSIKRKQADKNRAMFRMLHAQDIARYEQQSGVRLEDPTAFTPDSKDELDIFFDIEYRLPEEAITEEVTSKIFADNHLTEIKRVVIRDLIETGLGVMRVYTDVNGVIRLRRVKPENFFYSYSEYSDFRDCAFMGEKINMKVSEFRKRFSTKFDEKSIWNMAVHYGQGDNKNRYDWSEEYVYAQYRPYDDWTLPVIYVEVKTDNSIFIKEKVSKKNIPIIDISSKKPAKVGDNTKVSEKNLDKIYCGWYLMGSSIMLEWGPSKYDIRPQDNLSEQFFTYCPCMYDGIEMRNVAIPEKIKPSVTQMIVAHLKIQQLIAKMRPAGYIYDTYGLSNITLGDGKTLTPLDMQRFHQQTGDYYWNSVGADGQTRQQPPILPSPNAEGMLQIKELVEVYNFYLSRLQDDLGTNPAAAGQGVNPRMGLGVMRQQLRAANSSVSNVYDAWVTIANNICQKVTILLWDDIVYESSSYMEYFEGKNYQRDVYFNMQMQMQPDDAEKEYVEQMIQTSLSAGIITFEEAFKVRNIKNPKIAEMYLGKMQKRRMQQQMQEIQARTQANQQVQEQSIAQNTQSKAAIEEKKAQGKIIAGIADAQTKQEMALQQFVQQALLDSMKTGVPLTPQIQQIVDTYMSGEYNPQNGQKVQDAMAQSMGQPSPQGQPPVQPVGNQPPPMPITNQP